MKTAITAFTALGACLLLIVPFALGKADANGAGAQATVSVQLLVTMTLTGAQIEQLLEQQWSGANATTTRILQVSNGFTYAYDAGRPATDRVNIADIRLNGTPISPTASYRVAVNIFLADGGDGFTVLTSGTDRLGGEVDLDALEANFRASSPVAPGPRNRITRLN